MWNDRRVDPDDLCFRATVSASVDAGVAFLTSIPLDTASVCPLGKNTGRPLQLDGFTARYLQGGETEGSARSGMGNFSLSLLAAVERCSYARP